MGYGAPRLCNPVKIKKVIFDLFCFFFQFPPEPCRIFQKKIGEPLIVWASIFDVSIVESIFHPQGSNLPKVMGEIRNALHKNNSGKNPENYST